MEYDKFCEMLYTKYNRIFEQIPYIECEQGWFDIIESLSNELNEVSKQYHKNAITVVQIKEKFGGLRYYVNYELPQEDLFEIEQIISKYEHLSHKTCQSCGEEGSIRAKTAYWVATYCNNCADKLKES